MFKEKDTQANLTTLIQEIRNFYNLEKHYLRYSAAEQLTLVISKLAIVIVVALIGFVSFIFLGLALVHWFGSSLGNLSLGYALYAASLLLILLLFYINRRKWIILPLARLMMHTFIPIEEDEEGGEDDKD